MVIRELDHYRINEKTGEVIRIVKAKQREDYNPEKHRIFYLIESNKHKGLAWRDGKVFPWCSFKRVNKLRAKLLW